MCAKSIKGIQKTLSSLSRPAVSHKKHGQKSETEPKMKKTKQPFVLLVVFVRAGLQRLRLRRGDLGKKEWKRKSSAIFRAGCLANEAAELWDASRAHAADGRGKHLASSSPFLGHHAEVAFT